jgi:hypothetical protein
LPFIDGCRSQKKLYVPVVLKVQLPLHPAAVGLAGIDVQLDGALALKSAL